MLKEVKYVIFIVMKQSKKILILSLTVVFLLLFTFLFVYLNNRYFPREEVPTMREGRVIAENWIRNFSSLYPYYGKDLSLLEEEEVSRGEYRFTFSFITDRPEYGVHKNAVRIKTADTEVVEAVTNGIYDEIKSEYIEREEVVALYFILEKDEDYELVKVERNVTALPIDYFEEAVIKELFSGPTQSEIEEGYSTAIAQGGEILSFRINNETAYIETDFDIEQSEIALEQLRKTVFQFDTVSHLEIPEKETITVLEIEGIPENFRFNSDLEEGMEKEDVKYLQIILNADPETIVTQDGAGSPGEEVEFFDSATTRAVMAFQRKYSTEILEPAGMMLSTGVVDVYTRDKLNAILEEVSW